jgi:hypothetical protein
MLKHFVLEGWPITGRVGRSVASGVTVSQRIQKILKCAYNHIIEVDKTQIYCNFLKTLKTCHPIFEHTLLTPHTLFR